MQIRKNKFRNLVEKLYNNFNAQFSRAKKHSKQQKTNHGQFLIKLWIVCVSILHLKKSRMIIEFFLWDIQVHVRLLKILGDCFF